MLLIGGALLGRSGSSKLTTAFVAPRFTTMAMDEVV
jgi:hypothetical protein